MKKLLLFCLVLFFSGNIEAQDGYKKWVLLEHFTNTRCGICGSVNPQFYTRWSALPDDVRHISYHPSFPYSGCAIYQSNPTENSKRASFYGVQATPFVLKNGKAGTSASQVSTTVLNNLVGATSPLLVQVQESGITDRTVDVSVFSHPTATLPTGGLKLYVAVVEKTYNYDAPNGEDVHHNVFRTMIVDGEDFNAAASSGKVDLSYTYNVQSSWAAEEIYTIAWVQDASTKDIYNSGSSLDPQTVSATAAYSGSLKIGPNPVQSNLNLEFEEALDGTVELFDLVGKIHKSTAIDAAQMLQLDMSDLVEGVYLLRIQSNKGILTRRVLVKR